MPGQDEHLRTALDELHEQLESVDKVSPEVRDSLEQVIDDLRGVLQRSEQSTDSQVDHASIVERIQETASHFEESHPVLYGTLGKLMDVLSQMGI